jgi:hypothetical protein
MSIPRITVLVVGATGSIGHRVVEEVRPVQSSYVACYVLSSNPVKTVWLPETIEHRAIDDLTPYARNPTAHFEEQIAQLRGSIRRFGWRRPGQTTPRKLKSPHLGKAAG